MFIWFYTFNFSSLCLTVLLTFVIFLACFGDFRRSTYYRLTFSLVVIALSNMRFSCLFFSERLFFSFFQQEETVFFLSIAFFFVATVLSLTLIEEDVQISKIIYRVPHFFEFFYVTYHSLSLDKFVIRGLFTNFDSR